jgi:hypothetical protein
LLVETRQKAGGRRQKEIVNRSFKCTTAYYIQNEALVREVELNQFPPPDLAIEIDITSSSINRFSIYAALGIPEVWLYNGQTLTILSLQNGKYVSQDKSAALPLLKAEDILRFLALSSTMGETSLVKQFRQWVKKAQKKV